MPSPIPPDPPSDPLSKGDGSPRAAGRSGDESQDQDKAIASWLSEPAATPNDERSPESSADDVFEAELATPFHTARVPPRPRRKLLPLTLFVLTCFSTFLAGACNWLPPAYMSGVFGPDGLMPLRRVLIARWEDGLIYMFCVLAILLTHEMGHFVATLWHRIPASYPFFLPLPISPLGTLGAVIGMDGLRADRRQMFDIGIAGPLAGLVVAVPILLIGVNQLEFIGPRYGAFKLDNPLLIQMVLWVKEPAGYVHGEAIWHGQLNPYFMAGWVGLLITGLNMLPVSQLDGGHVTYTLFRKRAHWIARLFMLLAVGWILLSGHTAFLLMVFLIMLVGTDHPPTSNDEIPLGWFRTVLGLASLVIPILCFAPRAMMFD